MQDFGGKSYPPAQPPTQEQKYWALGAHLGVFVLGFIAPLIVWAVKKEESDYLAKSALSAMVFHLGIFIVAIVLCGITFCIGGIGAFLPMLAGIFYAVIATIKSQEGLIYEYPMTGKFINK